MTCLFSRWFLQLHYQWVAGGKPNRLDSSLLSALLTFKSAHVHRLLLTPLSLPSSFSHLLLPLQNHNLLWTQGPPHTMLPPNLLGTRQQSLTSIYFSASDSKTLPILPSLWPFLLGGRWNPQTKCTGPCCSGMGTHMAIARCYFRCYHA